MDEATFFEHYLLALEEALCNDEKNYGFHVNGPDWYIKDEFIRDKIGLFEDENYNKSSYFFQKVAYYFDAKSHYHNYVGNTDIHEYKLQLLSLISFFKNKYKLKF